MKAAADATLRVVEPPAPGQSAQDDERIGRTVLGQYEIVRVLGEGGMGTVYEARHSRLGRRVAVKFVKAGAGADPKLLARFEQEALSAGALESEHIPAVIDFAPDEDGAPCLVMEFLDGRNLAELLEAEGPMQVARAVGIVQQACRGLKVAHHAGIVHRDLKPSNLIVCRSSDGRDLVKIVDFGIAKVLRPRDGASDTTTGAALGTPYYMSPEQARGEKKIDPRADIYTLGVILYELLTAQKPHPGDTYNAIIYHILSKAPVPIRELRAEIPEGLARIIHAAMDTDPEARPASAERLERALAPYGPTAAQQLGAFDDTVRADPASDGARAAETGSGRGRVLVAFVAGGLLSGAVAWSLRAEPPMVQAEPAPPPVVTAPAASLPAAEVAPAPSAAPPGASTALPAPTPAAPAPPSASATPAPAQRPARVAAPATPAAPSANRRFDYQNPYQ